MDTDLDWAFLNWVNRLPGPTYLIALNAFVSAGCFLPSYYCIRYLCTTGDRRAQEH